MSLDRFCRKPVIDIRPDQTVFEAAQRMRSRHVGSVFVTDEEGGRPVGVLTDRDIVVRVVGAGLDPTTTAVGDVMTPSPITLRADESIDVALFRMREKGIRRLPIVDRQWKLVGTVSLDDLLVLLSAELGQTAAVVRDNSGP